MADLRGQKLKDSYQNVVTRGTGNKLENGNGVEFADLDDKASLSTLGSNSNGYWFKLDSGILIQVSIQSFSNVPIDNAYNYEFRSGNLGEYSWPIDFDTFIGCLIDVDTSNVFCDKRSPGTESQTPVFRLFKSQEETFGESGQVVSIGIGLYNE